MPRCSTPRVDPVSVRDALALINHTLDEVLAEQEGEFDADTRWALAWFEQQGFTAGEYGVAETLATAKNTSVAGMVAGWHSGVEGRGSAAAPPRGVARGLGPRPRTVGFPSGRSSTTSCASWTSDPARPVLRTPRQATRRRRRDRARTRLPSVRCSRAKGTAPRRPSGTTPWSRAGRRSRAWRSQEVPAEQGGLFGDGEPGAAT